MCKAGKEGVVEGISLLIGSLSPPPPLPPPPPTFAYIAAPYTPGERIFCKSSENVGKYQLYSSALYWTTRHIRANFSEIFSPLYSEIGHPNVMIKTRHCNLGYFLVLIGFFPSI